MEWQQQVVRPLWNNDLRRMRDDARNDDRCVKSNAALYMNRGHDQDVECAAGGGE
jgi:hypothetical protein